MPICSEGKAPQFTGGGCGYFITVFPAGKAAGGRYAEMGAWIRLVFHGNGGVLGAKIILKCGKMRYRSVFAMTALLVFSGVLVEHSGIYLIMTLGGFLAAFSDDALQVRTNAILQDMFPSEQRATLISIESFTFSMIMIVLSPLAGIVFSYW